MNVLVVLSFLVWRLARRVLTIVDEHVAVLKVAVLNYDVLDDHLLFLFESLA